MNFWWVNHKQTAKEEVSGGYIWSPTKNNDGSRNQTYLNLQDVVAKDIIFSYAGKRISAIGIAESNHTVSEKPAAFGKSGDQWAKQGWIVAIRWIRLSKPIVPQEHLSAIVPLLPRKYSPIRETGDGNQKFYLMRISQELGRLLVQLARNGNLQLLDLIEDNEREVTDDGEERRIQQQSISVVEKDQLIKARRGQGIFRSNLELVENRCRMTGIEDRRVLVASHIKPWRAGSNDEKLDGNNGLLLSPHVDRLFDRGWISFSDNGDVICPTKSICLLAGIWSLDLGKNVGRFNSRQQRFLEYHRSRELRRGD
jgi:putative restriction endonuclease